MQTQEFNKMVGKEQKCKVLLPKEKNNNVLLSLSFLNLNRSVPIKIRSLKNLSLNVI